MNPELSALKEQVDSLNQQAWDNRVVNSTQTLALSKQVLEILDNSKLDYPLGRAHALKCSGFALIRISKNEEVESTLLEAKEIFDSLDDVEGKATCLEYLGILMRNLGNYKDSLSYILESLRLHETIKNDEGIATSCYHLGVTYKYSGNYVEALEYLHRCLRIAHNHSDEKSFKSAYLVEAYSINIIGSVYFEIDNYDEALNYFKQGLKLRQRGGDKLGEAGSLDNIGSIYLKAKNWELAEDYFEKSLQISKSINDKRGQGNTLYHLAEIQKEIGKFANADKLLQESLKLRREINDRKGEAEILLLLSDLKGQEQDSRQEIVDYLLKALKISKSIDALDLMGKVHWSLYEHYKNIHDFNKALNHLEKYDSVEKNIRKASINDKILNYKIRERAEESEKETLNVKMKNEELARLNKEIRRQKEATDIALSNLKKTQGQLIHAEKMASLGELTAGIAHEIQNPLNFVTNFADLSEELLDEISLELNNGDLDEALVILGDVKQNLAKINHHGKRADQIVKGMLQHSRSSSGIKEATDLNNLIKEYLNLSYHGLRAKDLNFSTQITTHLDTELPNVSIIPQEIGRVLLNIINNAFYAVNDRKKTASASYVPQVEITSRKAGENAFIEIKDNGNGISASHQKKIFQPFFTTKPTGEGTGLGLSLSYDIIKAHEGELKINSIEGEGSVFTIILPMQLQN